jgi:hypothetical protein
MANTNLRMEDGSLRIDAIRQSIKKSNANKKYLSKIAQKVSPYIGSEYIREDNANEETVRSRTTSLDAAFGMPFALLTSEQTEWENQ